jgi:hypothetical protein
MDAGKSPQNEIMHMKTFQIEYPTPKASMHDPRNPARGRGSRSQLAFWAAMALVALSVAGCGTTSNLKSTSTAQELDFSNYTRVLVKDFEDKATQREKPAKQAAKRGEMERVCHDFADRLANEIDKKRVFEAVARTGPDDASTLVIGGSVSRYEEGNATARLWVGMGAGSSYFDAQLEFRQGGTGALLATVTTDKNSWVLGGGLAAGQTPESFMQEAAVKVADELQRAKTGQLVVKK